MTNRREFIRCTSAALAVLSAQFPMTLQAAHPEQLPSRLIPGTSESLPVIGLGNADVFQSGNLDVSRELLDILLDKGGAYVDTSGKGRYVVGRIMREMNARDKLFLGTYVGASGEKGGREDLLSVQEAQGGGALDLVLTRNLRDFAAHPDKFRRWKDAGLTRYVGVARSSKRYHKTMMKLMVAGSVDFVQVNYSILEPEAAETLLPMAQDKGVAILINRAFVNGKYFSIVKGQALPAWAAEFDCHSWAQFALKFILAHPAVNCVLTETSNPEHAVENLDAGFGRLPDEKTRLRMSEVIRGLT